LLFFVCEDGGSSFSAVLFYGHELTLLMFEVLIFALVDLVSHNYFLGAAVTFFIMEVSLFYFSTGFALAQGAFWKLKELLKEDVNITTRKRLLNRYVFSVLKYAWEGCAVNKRLVKRMHAFEHWCYRRMLKISWKDKVSNTDVMKRIKEKEP